MRRKRCAMVLLMATVGWALPAAAQDPSLVLVAALPMGATALTVWASDAGGVVVRRASLGQTDVVLSDGDASAWIDSSTAVLNARPARQPNGTIRLRSGVGGLVLERELDDTGDRLWLATSGDSQRFPVSSIQVDQLNCALAAAREASRRMNGGPQEAASTAGEPARCGPSSGERPDGAPVYFEFQVEKQVTPLPGNEQPRYPAMLRSAGVEGEVLAQFVVDTTGAAELRTFKVLKSSHDLFTLAVEQALATMRFSAAEVGGRKVRQLVEMPFVFSFNHD